MRPPWTIRLLALLPLLAANGPSAALEGAPATPAVAAEAKAPEAAPQANPPAPTTAAGPASGAATSAPSSAPTEPVAPTALTPAATAAGAAPSSSEASPGAPADAGREPNGPAPPAPAAEPEPRPAKPAPSPARTRTAAPPKPRPPAAPALARVSSDPTPSYGPETFLRTMQAAERHLALAEAGGWPVVPPGPPLKAGDRGPRVALLKQRLAASEDLAAGTSPADAFDAAVVAAVKRFQTRHGLPETGLVGKSTLAALNVPAGARARQLASSAQRLIGSSFPFGERYVVVNIPAATVEAVERGRVAKRHVAVVGKPDRPSPMVETRVTNVNLNPTWTVPVSLIRKDIIPHMRADPGYLAKMKIRVLDGGGREIEPGRIDWSTEKAVNYTLRQDPGAANSLGQIRIDMPNRHAVYLHDTPTKNLFARELRFHSSGCVRVADVKGLVRWLLEGTIGPNGPWTSADIGAAIATGQRQDIKLARPVPVAWVYLTGYAAPDGTVHFRDDVYGLDGDRPEPVLPAVAGPGPPARPVLDVPTTSSIGPIPPRPAARPRTEGRPYFPAARPEAALVPPGNVGGRPR